MLSKEEIEGILNKCGNCKLTECIGCDTTYTERKQIREYIEKLETDKQELIKKLKIAIDFAKTGKDIISRTQVTCLENVLKIVKGEKE